jgi:hypothetical protein
VLRRLPTMSAPATSPHLLRIGSKDARVRELQERLAELGFHPGNVDGVFGARTEEAVRRFQESRRLPADGIVGQRTLAAMSEADAELKASASSAVQTEDAPARLSPSLDRLPDVPMNAYALVKTLLRDHPSYVKGRAGSFEIAEPPNAPSKPFSVWLAEVQPLFALGPDGELHTRLMVLGLALLDAELYRRLSEGGFLRALAAELREPLDEILTPVGRRLWQTRTALKSSAPLLSDRPATEDELGRFFVAGALAARLREAREGLEGPLLLHLHGAWGSGKSSLLKFLHRELTHPTTRFVPVGGTRPDPWVVVEFNAWQHQRIAPPWWWLLTAVYHGGARALRNDFGRWAAFRFRFLDYLWRVWSARLALIAVTLSLAFFGLTVWAIAAYGPDDFGGAIALTGAILSVVGAAVGLMKGTAPLLLVGSAGGATSFLRRTQDPMEALKRRYGHLIRRLGHPVAIFVDDLDRCQAEYVVEFLEGIHTLFGDEAVSYVVAGDRRWVCNSFTQVYDRYRATVDLPGRPLGYLFLEKTFQLSTAVPRLTLPDRRRYLDVLLGARRDGREPLEDAREEAKRRYASLTTEEQIREELARTPASDLEQLAAREAALVQARAPEVQEQREHLLSRFVHLLEPNPRGIKRLVNAYGFELEIQIVGSTSIETGQRAIETLALWTILNLRWPLLGEYLADRPAKVTQIGTGGKLADVPPELEELFWDPDVQAVVNGDGVDASLTEEAIRSLVRLHRADSRVEAAV